MKNKNHIIPTYNIQDRTFSIRGKQVILDSDLAILYKVETTVLNQAVKRNIKRFLLDYMFQLTKEEFEFLISQSVILENKRGKHRKYLPFVFTEQGVSMLSTVLKSDTAIEISIKIENAFVEMRKYITNIASIFQYSENVELKKI